MCFVSDCQVSVKMYSNYVVTAQIVHNSFVFDSAGQISFASEVTVHICYYYMQMSGLIYNFYAIISHTCREGTVVQRED